MPTAQQRWLCKEHSQWAHVRPIPDDTRSSSRNHRKHHHELTDRKLSSRIATLIKGELKDKNTSTRHLEEVPEKDKMAEEVKRVDELKKQFVEQMEMEWNSNSEECKENSKLSGSEVIKAIDQKEMGEDKPDILVEHSVVICTEEVSYSSGNQMVDDITSISADTRQKSDAKDNVVCNKVNSDAKLLSDIESFINGIQEDTDKQHVEDIKDYKENSRIPEKRSPSSINGGNLNTNSGCNDPIEAFIGTKRGSTTPRIVTNEHEKTEIKVAECTFQKEPDSFDYGVQTNKNDFITEQAKILVMKNVSSKACTLI